MFGTRPEAIKLAPLVLQCTRHKERVRAIVCTTGQHREMLKGVMDYFGLAADADLGLMSPGQSLADLAARCLQGVRALIVHQRPECVVVQGDTTSAMAAAMAAFYERVPAVHIEAGLRSANLQAPWPEEFNRRVVTLSAAVHCAPTALAAQALAAEGVPGARIHITGNTVIDALLTTIERERNNSAQWQARHPYLDRGPLVLITGHRRENFGQGLARLCDALRQLSIRFRDAQFVWPVHLNPNVDGPVRAALAGLANIHLTPPAPYPHFVWLMDRAALILTDSGGVQEEAPSLGKRVLVLRETTERPEALTTGLVELVGTDVERLIDRATHWLSAAATPGAQAAQPPTANPFGDGRAAQRIVQLIAERAWLA